MSRIAIFPDSVDCCVCAFPAHRAFAALHQGMCVDCWRVHEDDYAQWIQECEERWQE